MLGDLVIDLEYGDKNIEKYEKLKQTINDIGTKYFLTSIKMDKRNNNIKKTGKNLSNGKTGDQTKINLIDIPSQIFEETEKGEYPKKFLKDVKMFMQHKNIAEEEILLLLENGLKGKTAKWFTMVKDVIRNIDTFQ